MKPYIIIALTTYSDLNSDRFGADLFSAIGEVEPRLLPQKAGWLGTLSRDVKTSEDFASIWREDRQIYTSERRGGARRTTGCICGVEWARRSAIKNKGKIIHRGGGYSNQAEALVLHAEWRERVDWLRLFQQLCLLTRAAHGMLHLFTPGEIAELDPDDHSLYRQEGFHGQDAFTYSIDSYGTRRQIGPGDPNMRVFRQIPKLTWATWLGANFNEQYDLQSLKNIVANPTENKDGFLFTVTDQVGDVSRDFTTFKRRRELGAVDV
jgi:hypothetical protein